MPQFGAGSLVVPSGFGLRQSSGAFYFEAVEMEAPEDRRCPKRYHAFNQQGSVSLPI
jgi:hypothetical protein